MFKKGDKVIVKKDVKSSGKDNNTLIVGAGSSGVVDSVIEDFCSIDFGTATVIVDSAYLDNDEPTLIDELQALEDEYATNAINAILKHHPEWEDSAKKAIKIDEKMDVLTAMLMALLVVD